MKTELKNICQGCSVYLLPSDKQNHAFYDLDFKSLLKSLVLNKVVSHSNQYLGSVADLRFVKKFTLPDFWAKKFTY